MTLEALDYAIARLIIKRRDAHGDLAEQERINIKLDNLYNLRFLMIQQMYRKN